MKQLFWYQAEDAEHIAKRKTALVGHMPRIGKSAIAIEAANLVGAKVAVFVVPANTILNWLREIDDFRTAGWIAVVVSVAQVGKFLARFRRLKIRIDVLVIDEAHFMKNPESARSKAVFNAKLDGKGSLSELADRIYMLTGTPMPQNPTDLWAMLRVTAPELILQDNGKPMSFSKFRDHYCKMAHTAFGMKIVGAKNAGKLREKLIDSGFCRRRTRSEVFGRDILPPTQVIIPPPTEFKAQLKALENSEEGKKIVEAIRKEGLRGLIKLEKEIAGLRQLYGVAKVPGIVSLITDELNEEPDMKIIIGAVHTRVVDALAAGFARFGVIVFDGRVTDKARKDRLNQKFLYDPTCRVVVGQITAMSVGLDFSKADHCLFAEPSYVSSDNAQFRSRVFHPSSTSPKFTRFAVLPGSIDQEVIKACDKKLADSATVFG